MNSREWGNSGEQNRGRVGLIEVHIGRGLSIGRAIFRGRSQKYVIFTVQGIGVGNVQGAEVQGR